VNTEFITGMRARLLEMRAALEEVADTAEASSRTVELDQSRVGRLSRMDAMQLQAMAQESGRRRSEALRRIAAAIARIDIGDYGICLDCEETIPEARLAFDPAAERCIECASAREAERNP
jgi:DnaK suppressor protein